MVYQASKDFQSRSTHSWIRPILPAFPIVVSLSDQDEENLTKPDRHEGYYNNGKGLFAEAQVLELRTMMVMIMSTMPGTIVVSPADGTVTRWGGAEELAKDDSAKFSRRDYRWFF
jgi:hypothetical protein